MLRFLRNYLERHRHPANRWLHAIALPVTFILPVIWLSRGAPWWALGAFVLGYTLQFAGHAIEGNDAGEVVLVKRLLGRPATPIAPSDNRSSCAD
jgi:hypothetical protein